MPVLEALPTAGTYLTEKNPKGKGHLYLVVASEGEEVALENCFCPQENPRWVKASTVAVSMRRVVPRV